MPPGGFVFKSVFLLLCCAGQLDIRGVKIGLLCARNLPGTFALFVILSAEKKET